MIYLYIALGGAAGSLLRYSLGGAVQRLSASGFPIGTLVVNVCGCFIIGILIRHFMNRQLSPELRPWLVVGRQLHVHEMANENADDKTAADVHRQSADWKSARAQSLHRTAERVTQQ